MKKVLIVVGILATMGILIAAGPAGQVGRYQMATMVQGPDAWSVLAMDTTTGEIKTVMYKMKTTYGDQRGTPFQQMKNSPDPKQIKK